MTVSEAAAAVRAMVNAVRATSKGGSSYVLPDGMRLPALAAVDVLEAAAAERDRLRRERNDCHSWVTSVAAESNRAATAADAAEADREQLREAIGEAIRIGTSPTSSMRPYGRQRQERGDAMLDVLRAALAATGAAKEEDE